jgi:glucans biosynthesis protein C
MAGAPLEQTAPQQPAPPGQRRLLFIDNIRWTMILLVLSMHAVDTYSPFGNWYYRDRAAVGFGTALAFATYQSFLQAFFMALLFFIAGYFAVPSYDRKGFARFIGDRAVRLGVPTLLYMMAIGPLTQYFLSRSWGSGGFGRQWLTHLADGEWLSETGPMWFCAALLIFCVAYGALRRSGLKEARIPLVGDRRSSMLAAAFIAAMAVATFVVRIGEPEGTAVLNLQLGDFPQYLLMFAAGALAYRGDWLASLPARFCTGFGTTALLLAVPLFVALIMLGGAVEGHTQAYSGGLNLVSAGKCLWEALVCVGMSLIILSLYRSAFDRQGRVARWLSSNAFGVYLIHPPILVGFALLLHGIAVHPIPKAAALTLLAAAGSFAASALVLRRMPLLRAIV